MHLAHIWGMYVQPCLRGQGVGDALLQALIAHACTMLGLHQLRLSVNSHNHRAIALYSRHGFVRYGTYPQQLYAQGIYHDMDGMLLQLTPAPQLPPLHT